MIGFESILYSLRNLKNRRMRSFLTVLSIFIGIATIFIFISFGLGLFGYINGLVEGSAADKVIIQAKSGGVTPGLDDTFKLEDKDLRAVERTPGVIEATGSYIKVAKIEFRDELKYVFLMGYDPDVPLVLDIGDIELEAGRSLWSGETGKVLLGYNFRIPDKVFSRGLKVNDKITVQDVDLRIIGFFGPIGNPQDDSNVYVVNGAIDDLYPDKNNSYGWIVARVNPKNIEDVIKNIERNLRNTRGLDKGKEDFFVQSFNDMIESYSGALNIIIGFIILIALISVIVSAVNTANTMVTSVLERTKEIGIIKAIGAENSEVFGIFFFESSFLGLIAGVIGVLLGWGVSYIGGVFLDNLGWGFLAPAFPIALFVGLILFAGVTGAVSGVIPAMKASKINVVDALRYE